MNNKKKCRLCLKICESEVDFKVVEETALEMLSFSLLNLDLTVSDEPVMCGTCSDNLKNCFEYKVACLNTKNNEIDFIDGKHCLVGDTKEVPQSENADKTTVSVLEGYKICYFCSKPTKNISAFFNNEKVRNIIKNYFPELDLSFTNERTVCILCRESLQHHSTFITDCLSVEEKIKKYCETVGTNSKGQVDLSDVLLFTQDVMHSKDDCCNVGDIKIEEPWQEEVDNTSALVRIKNEVYIKMEDRELNVEEEENGLKIEDDRSDSLYENYHLLCLKEEPQEVSSMTEDTEECTSELIMNHMLTPQEASKIKVYSCKMCGYKTTSKRGLPIHMHMHGISPDIITYKCETCSYQTVRNENFRRHTLIHKNISEVTSYKCEICEYQCKHKTNLERHMLNHKSASEVTMHKCEVCLYQTRHKYNLQEHMLVHKNGSEATTFKCEVCECQFRQKSSLRRHMLNHKNISEIMVYKCELCPYQSIHKNYLRKHKLVHKNIPKVSVYKCGTCKCQFKQKESLRRHMLDHRDISEVTMYKCEHCSYQSRHKFNLREHILVHKDVSKLTAYNCGTCTYQTKRKGLLQRHMRRMHKNDLEVMMYKCEKCEFQTKYKSSLQGHSLTHKSKSEVATFKCDTCSFESKYKRYLRRHVLMHKKS